MMIFLPWGAPEGGSGHAAVQNCHCFPRIKFSFSSSFGSWLLFRDGVLPHSSWGCTHSFPGVQSPLQWVRGTFWGVQGGGVSAATLPSPAQPGGNWLCHRKSWPLPAVNFSFSQWILAAPGAEEGARSLGQLVHPPLGPAQGIYFKGGMFFPKNPDPSTTRGWKSPAPTRAQGRGKALSPSTC